MKTVILAPLDPVHDNAVKLLQRKLTEAGYGAIALPPGVTAEEVIERALTEKPAAILVSRTLGYKVAETLSGLVDLADAAGLRPHTRLGVGGMAVTREIGAELGFDGVFSGDLNMAAVIAFIENRPVEIMAAAAAAARVKPEITAGYSYHFKDAVIEGLLDEITSQLLSWVEGKSSPGIQRAQLRAAMLAEPDSSAEKVRQRELYVQQCDSDIQAFYRAGALPEGVRWLNPSEVERLPQLTATESQPVSVRHTGERPLIFTQYGTGCPVMDAVHIKVAEAWGTDGLLHFDPSWGAQREGLLDGLLSHEHDGTILTLGQPAADQNRAGTASAVECARSPRAEHSGNPGAGAGCRGGFT